MKTLEYFQSWATAELVITAMLAGAAVVAMSALLSVLVVLKRLAFIGQGVSHSAFGGIGVAAVVAAVTGAAWAGQGGIAELLIVMAFCIAAALGMAAVSDRAGGAVRVDTGIGLYLVASMAVGAVLVEVARTTAGRLGHPVGVRSWESILFGSILGAGWTDVLIAAGLAGAVALVLWLVRRPLLFWAFDEGAAPAFGVPTTAMRTVLMVLLAIATVTAMKVAGVILATALLVLPGATALKVAASLRGVVGLSLGVGLAGLTGGMILSLEAELQPGPCIVLVLTALFVAGWLVGGRRPAAVPSVSGGPG